MQDIKLSSWITSFISQLSHIVCNQRLNKEGFLACQVTRIWLMLTMLIMSFFFFGFQVHRGKLKWQQKLYVIYKKYLKPKKNSRS
jgi:purine-cytosine permease-like protein